MERDGLYERLASARYLLETATARFTDLTHGVEHPRVDTAHEALRTTAETFDHAAGGLGPWARNGLSFGMLGIAAWLVAAFAGGIIKLPAGWTIAVTVAALVGLMLPVNAVCVAIARRISRRRLRRASAAVRVEPPAGVGPAAEVLALLRMARRDLAAAMRYRSAARGSERLARTAAGFTWLHRHDVPLFAICYADRHVCNAIYSIEIWLPSQVEQQ